MMIAVTPTETRPQGQRRRRTTRHQVRFVSVAGVVFLLWAQLLCRTTTATGAPSTTTPSTAPVPPSSGSIGGGGAPPGVVVAATFVGPDDGIDHNDEASKDEATKKTSSSSGSGAGVGGGEGQRPKEDASSSAAAALSSSFIDHGQALMRWMDRMPGAYFHPSLVIRRMQGGSGGGGEEDEPTSTSSSTTTPPNSTESTTTTATAAASPFYGMYAVKDIASGELLLEIPRSMVFHPDPPTMGDRVVRYDPDDDDGYYYGVVTRVQSDGTYDIRYDHGGEVERGVDPDDVSHEDYPSNCATVHKLVREMKLGSESYYGPYVQYLLSQPPGQLPTAWSIQGQSLLKKVLGSKGDDDDDNDNDDDNGDEMLQPYGSFGWVQDDWHKRCQGGTDPMSEQAYLLMLQRGWDEVMIPVMDMLSHRNPPYLNTDHDPIRDGESVKLRATQRIRAGDEIYTSYNFCADCSARTHNYGTPEILRDYGFVEEYPQRWYFHHPRMSFDINPVWVTDENGNQVETGETRLHWSTRPSTGDGPRFLREQRRRLKRMQQTVFRVRDDTIPAHEWDVTNKFVDAMVKAYGEALNSLQAEEEDRADAQAMAACEADGTCHLERSNVYRDLLAAEPETWGDSRPHTCDTKRIYDFDSWVTLDTIQSPYQALGYATVPANSDDMCFDLDDVVQICASYRPHYHEMMVHFAAKFVMSVRRILFVGGGDSMLLHEALKYRDLELVVGLELDQVVPRNSFRYFGTQPHFDDSRVEWWFGDATKSLMMLPSDYFGSFDLVLVDLSETVQALSVTDGMNVMEALALLVKPDGVLVQNEYMHFLEQATVFQHTMHVHFDSVPIVCSQSLILASNTIDFRRDDTTDHAVDTLYDLLDEEDLRYSIVRDYQRNDTNPHHCRTWSKSTTVKETPAIQLRSPGTLFIVDADKVSPSPDPEALRKSMVAAIQAVRGIEVVSHTISTTSDAFTITILLKNGYIVARARPDHNFCAFDVHFWRLYHLQDSVGEALVASVAGIDKGVGIQPVVSSYRVVASGIFGSESWREDDIRRGPQLSMLCPSFEKAKDDKTTTSVAVESDLMNLFYRETVPLVSDKDFDVLVLCGRSLGDCRSADAFAQVRSIDTVLTVQPCFGLSDDETYAEHGTKGMLKCEKIIKEQLKESGLDSIRHIVLDPSAPFSLAQIVARIFSSESNVERFLAPRILVDAIVLGNESWRKTFVHRFRTHVFDAEPVFTFESTLTNDVSRFVFAVTSSGDEDFAERFLSFNQLVEEKSGLVSEVQKVRAGEFSFQHEFEPNQVFTHSDYDNRGAAQQWSEQLPLGLHTIFQFETIDKHLPALSTETLMAAIHVAFKSANVDDVVVDSSSVADGCIIFAHWQSNHGGNAVLLWDGRSHVDFNVFSWLPEGGDAFADRIESSILDALPDSDFERVLRDEQPRGTGRVVLYPKPRGFPVWSILEDAQAS